MSSMLPSLFENTRFGDYTFTLMPSGNLVLDDQLLPSQLGITSGDQFEVVITPDNIIILKKMERQTGIEPATSSLENSLSTN